MIRNEDARKALGKEFSHLSDPEIEELVIAMYNFWGIMIED
jgi:hypothetical protein